MTEHIGARAAAITVLDVQRLAVGLFLVAAGGCATGGVNPQNKMVPLTGEDPVFAVGRKTFPQSKARCFQAVLETFKNTGHGIDKQDADAGTVISGKATVFQGTTGSVSRSSLLTVANKFYVRVSGDGARCEVVVTKLRAWSNTVEVETRTWSWAASQLRGFITGVANELADVSAVLPGGDVQQDGGTPSSPARVQ